MVKAGKETILLANASGSEEEVVGRLGLRCHGSSSRHVNSASMPHSEDSMKRDRHILHTYTMRKLSMFHKSVCAFR